jgi:cell division protein FtsQ
MKALPQPVDVRLMNITATVLFVGLRPAAGGGAGLVGAAAPAVRHRRHHGAGRRGAQQRGHAARQRGAAAGRQLLHRRPAAGARRLRGRALGAAGGGAAPVPEPAARACCRSTRPRPSGAPTPSRAWSTRYGEVFEANPGDVEAGRTCRGWPGPRGGAAGAGDVPGLKPLFEPLDLASWSSWTLTGRGGWTLHLDSGAVVELGRGTRTKCWRAASASPRTLTQVTSKYGRGPRRW